MMQNKSPMRKVRFSIKGKYGAGQIPTMNTTQYQLMTVVPIITTLKNTGTDIKFLTTERCSIR